MRLPTEQDIMNWLNSIPEDTHEQYLQNLPRYKEIINNTPNHFLQFHLDDVIKKEQYELAEHIKNVANTRGYLLT